MNGAWHHSLVKVIYPFKGLLTFPYNADRQCFARKYFSSAKKNQTKIKLFISGVLKLRMPPFIRMPPLVVPGSGTRGGILKKVHFFQHFCLLFSFKTSSKTLFLQGKSGCGGFKSSKFSPAARSQHTTMSCYHSLSTVLDGIEGCH